MLRRIDLRVPDHCEEPLLGFADRHGMQVFSSPCIVDTGGGEEEYRLTGETIVSFLFSTVEQNPEQLGNAINAWLAAECPSAPKPEIRDYADDEDWMRTFRTYFQPIQVSENIVVRPPWCDPLPGEDKGITLLIDPGMAFGTGTHETTRLCLRLMRGIQISGGRFLDLGAGSGILAFALVKQGAAFVEAVEIDGPAVENLRKNAGLNGITDKSLDIICGDLAQFKPRSAANGLVANISSPVLLEHLPRMAGFLVKGAWGIFSGINSTNAPAIRKAFSSQPWRIIQEETEGEWHGFLVHRI
ncbi:MAG: 50S ribosomal protein L11 methyltransferase [Candidatus Riflebacteria bacterium]|nr:50S ribosomal protein L11 methyltransferase [Candidatus Riflebacteria bacterium]